ncbi:MAG: hypothetical protein K8S56_00455, partial [Candidatus Cloacimonetes bacterium]|nr:hypothetical protein [Candidatus Cloacimonadota bacterium]
IATSLLLARFPSLEVIPKSLLKFISLTNFTYGIRSITYFIEAINYKSFIGKELVASKMGLPFKSEQLFLDSNLARHIVVPDDGNKNIASLWNEIYDEKGSVVIKEQ